MANLIITIISIALVAVAAVMGAYYGGTAFSNSQVSSYAAQTIQIMQQIKAATLLYVESNPNYGSFTQVTQWGDALTANTNNTQYLTLHYYDIANGSDQYNSFNINYGAYGNLLDTTTRDPSVAGPLSGTAHMYSDGALNVVPDSTGNHLYVLWTVGSPFGPAFNFYQQLCYTINQQMGQVPYASSLTIVNSDPYYGGLNYSLPLGSDTTVYPGFFGQAFTGLPNLCSINGANEYIFEFAIPIF